MKYSAPTKPLPKQEEPYQCKDLEALCSKAKEILTAHLKKEKFVFWKPIPKNWQKSKKRKTKKPQETAYEFDIADGRIRDLIIERRSDVREAVVRVSYRDRRDYNPLIVGYLSLILKEEYNIRRKADYLSATEWKACLSHRDEASFPYKDGKQVIEALVDTFIQDIREEELERYVEEAN